MTIGGVMSPNKVSFKFILILEVGIILTYLDLIALLTLWMIILKSHVCISSSVGLKSCLYFTPSIKKYNVHFSTMIKTFYIDNALEFMQS